jgi:hypothetical protein
MYAPPPAAAALAAPAPAERELRDGTVRLVGIPLFGIVIPNLTGLFGPLGPTSPWYWGGYVWFVLLSGAIWQGNRFWLLRQREHFDWFSTPFRKVLALLFANVFYTAPLTVGMLVAWYHATSGVVDWTAVQVVALANVICVVFITHVYETVYLIRERETDMLAFERLELAKAQAELRSLESQLDPHFLFNSLNTLTHFIDSDPQRARAFTELLADVYRHLLRNRRRELVPLADELLFAERYVELLRLRFGDAVRLAVEGTPAEGTLLPPMALQTLIENAVKHNEVSPEAPLEVTVRLLDDSLEVTNGRRPKRTAAVSGGIGLANLAERTRRLTGRELVVSDDAERFTVLLPLLRPEAT